AGVGRDGLGAADRGFGDAAAAGGGPGPERRLRSGLAGAARGGGTAPGVAAGAAPLPAGPGGLPPAVGVTLSPVKLVPFGEKEGLLALLDRLTRNRRGPFRQRSCRPLRCHSPHGPGTRRSRTTTT